jgi:hypothetical protein
VTSRAAGGPGLPDDSEAPASGDQIGHGAADYFFRNLHQQLVQLSAQTDLKGSIMLTTSSLLIGLVAPQIVIEDDVRWGAVFFLLFDAGALLAAVLAVFPASAKLVGRGDPLYFAHAAQMTKSDYVDRMMAIAHTRQDVYEAMAANLHDFSYYMHHGKFRYLRWSYALFLVGAIGGLVIEGARLLLTM